MELLTNRRRVMSHPFPYDTNGFDYVDMGEAGIWAACNVGADSPTDYGDYFAWGETKPKDSYSWDNYKFGTEGKPTKYNKEDELTILELEDDAAHVNMGGDWRMPTKEEITWMISLCNFQKMSSSCFLFTLNANPNKQLIIPAGGFKLDNNLTNLDTRGLYHTSTIYPDGTFIYNYYIDFRPGYNNERNIWRNHGCTVRGFIPKI